MEFLDELGGGEVVAVGEFVEDAGFGDGEGTVVDRVAQDAELAGVEAVEVADGLDGVGDAGRKH